MPPLDATQRSVVEFASREGLTILSGKPGSGKTTVIGGVVQVWVDVAPKDTKVLVTSVSAAASVRCMDVIGYEDDTRVDYATIAGVFENSELARSLNFSKVVVDEAGMCAAHQLANLLDPGFILWEKVMMAGDKDQLDPIGSPSCFGAIQASDLDCFFHLEKIYRQQNLDCALVKNIDLIRRVENLRVEQLEKDKDTFWCLTSDFSEQDIRRVVRKVCEISFRDKKPAPQFIAITNQTCGIVNGEVQKVTQEWFPSHVFRSAEGELTYPNYEGDVVVCRENYPKSKRKRLMPDVANGHMGVVVRLEERGPGLKFRITRRKELTLEAYKVVHELGYCVTLHRAQGNEYDRVVLMFNIGNMRGLVDRKYLTVGLSRARKHLLLVANPNDLKQATHTGDPPRSTLLRRLQEEIIDPDEVDKAFQEGYASWQAAQAAKAAREARKQQQKERERQGRRWEKESDSESEEEEED